MLVWLEVRPREINSRSDVAFDDTQFEDSKQGSGMVYEGSSFDNLIEQTWLLELVSIERRVPKLTVLAVFKTRTKRWVWRPQNNLQFEKYLENTINDYDHQRLPNRCEHATRVFGGEQDWGQWWDGYSLWKGYCKGAFGTGGMEEDTDLSLWGRSHKTTLFTTYCRCRILVQLN